MDGVMRQKEIGGPSILMHGVLGSEMIWKITKSAHHRYAAHLTEAAQAELGIASPCEMRVGEAGTVPGTFGCLQSHRRALERVRILSVATESHVLILEDIAPPSPTGGAYRPPRTPPGPRAYQPGRERGRIYRQGR